MEKIVVKHNLLRVTRDIVGVSARDFGEDNVKTSMCEATLA